MTAHSHSPIWPGVPLALASAALFGASMPLSKILLGSVDPQILAGLLYLGAGMGLSLVHVGRNAMGLPAVEAPLRRSDVPWMSAIILFGGVLGPLLLMLGLNQTDAASGSLLFNLEGIATMAIAWLVFKENVDRRLLLGAAAIVLGVMVLSYEGQSVSFNLGATLIAGACLSWGIDNNLTRKLSSSDPVFIAMTKGLAAGVVNLVIGFARGGTLPAVGVTGFAALVGFLGVGVSLVLFVLALRHLGTARTGAYYALAPFIGALMSILFLGDHLTVKLVIASVLMAFGLWLHLTERHEHDHGHGDLEHEHAHIHDSHHQHTHEGLVSEPHSHVHSHKELRHTHAHYPDLHHRHGHG
jgi:drug/metabolite transporter (DMT)-like permease